MASQDGKFCEGQPYNTACANALSSPPHNDHPATTASSHSTHTNKPTHYNASHPVRAPSSPRQGAPSTSTSPQSSTEPVAFFLFFNCLATGRNIHRDRIVELAVQCWPYVENAPTFHSKVDSGQRKCNKQQKKNKRGQKKSSSHPDDSDGHSFPIVWKHLMQWLTRILNHATSVMQTQLYPVFVTHHGDTYDFHFLFNAMEEHGIALEAPLQLNIHFCDPVPLLKQYKDHAHPWLIESKSMSVGSLLNDWLPGQFDIGDLYICPGKAWLTAKLYTQSPMYWLLKEFPLYSTQEWIEYYKEVKQYKADKKSLEDNFPSNVPDVQRKFAVRSLLRWGYNFDALVDLYKSCTSPEHFRQEMKDCDLKSGVASHLTWKFVDEKILQTGTRQYKVRIKKNMPPQRYTHITDRRGRLWVLQVKNLLPPCIYSINDLFVNLPRTDQWRAPENLMLIRYPEAWYPAGGEGPEEQEILEHLGDALYNSNEDDDSQDSWDEEEDEEAAMRQSLQPIEDLYKEQAEPPPITTLQFGNESTAFNPFTDQKKQRGLQTELRQEENAKAIKQMWKTIKGDDQQLSSFGQAVQFCRPSGMEDCQPRKQKEKNLDEEGKDNNRKGQRNKKQAQINSHGRPERTFSRTQSWISQADSNKKTDGDHHKTETEMCRAKSWDNEASSSPAKPPSKETKSTAQTKDDDVNAAAHRMINFHLADTNKKSRNPKTKNSSHTDRSGKAQGKPRRNNNSRATTNEEREPFSNSEEKDKSWGNPKNRQSPTKWDGTSRGHQVGWGSQSQTTSTFQNVTSNAWGAKSQSQAWGRGQEIDRNTPPWGRGQQTDRNTPAWGYVSNGPVKAGNANPTTDEWGSSSNSIHVSATRPGDTAITNPGRDRSVKPQSLGSGNKNDANKHENLPGKSLARPSTHGNSGAAGMRRPREMSKAQTLAYLAGNGPGKTIADQTKLQPQSTRQVTPPKQTIGFHNNSEHNSLPKGESNFAAIARNQVWNSNRHGQKVKTISGQQWSNKSPKVVVTNNVEETENWDDEIVDDPCYGL